MSGADELLLPTRDEADDDLLKAAKKPRSLSATIAVKVGGASAPAPVAAAATAPAAPQAQRKLNTAAAVGGVDTGVEEDAPARKAARTAAAAPAAAPQLMDIRSGEWYYLDRNKQYCGPLTADDLKEKYEAEDDAEGISAGTYVWAKGVIAEWRPIERITELYEFLEDTEALRNASAPKRAQQGKNDKDGNAGSNNKNKRGGKRPRGVMEGENEKEGDGQGKTSQWFELKVNTSVYVSGLPDGTTPEELESFFKKVGIIKTDPVTKKPKVKVYKHNDGLVTFMRKESVDLAVKLLDGARFSDKQKTTIDVSPAKFEKKAEGEYQKRDMKEYTEAVKKAKKQNDSKLGWGDGDADPNERTVILKNVFSPEEERDEVNLFTMIKGDMQEEGGKHGTIERLRIFKGSQDGVVMIRFKSFIAAESCIKEMDNRWYRQRQLRAYMWDRKERFEKAADEESAATAKRTFGVGGQYGDISDSDDEEMN